MTEECGLTDENGIHSSYWCDTCHRSDNKKPSAKSSSLNRCRWMTDNLPSVRWNGSQLLKIVLAPKNYPRTVLLRAMPEWIQTPWATQIALFVESNLILYLRARHLDRPLDFYSSWDAYWSFENNRCTFSILQTKVCYHFYPAGIPETFHCKTPGLFQRKFTSNLCVIKHLASTYHWLILFIESNLTMLDMTFRMRFGIMQKKIIPDMCSEARTTR